MRQLRIAAPLAVATALCLAQPAFAKQPPSYVPPGVSGANQYTETLPGPGGNEPTGGSGTHPGKKGTAKALGNKNAHQLEALGPEGRAAAELAAAAGGASAAHTGGQATGGDKSASAAGNGKSGVGQVLGNLSGADGGGEGMGILLPGLIVIVAIAAGTFAIARHRARPQT